MVITQWSDGVNQKFFEYNEKPKDNYELTEMASGRVVGRKLNTRDVMTFSCSLFLERKKELKEFWRWYKEDLGGTTGAFRCEALDKAQGLEEGAVRYYRFSETPEPGDTGQRYRKLNFQIEEVY